MNKDKLNEAANNIPTHATDALYDIGYVYGFIDCVNWLMRQPIADRLTDEEKKALRWYYDHKYWNENITHNPELMTKYNQGRLIGIFGSDLFKK